MHMVMFVLDNPNQLDAILNAWEKVGISGATIIESTGINRYKRAQLVGSAFMAGINRLMSASEENHYTLFAIVNKDEMIEDCLLAVESIVGDLNQPNTGIFFAWPLDFVKGVPGLNEPRP
jgi:nitrogen regulatory protein PII